MNCRRPFLFALFTAMWVAAAPGLAAVVTYDPALGTVPQAQGWNYFEPIAPSPPATVGGGTLNQGPTSYSGLQYWMRNDEPISFVTGLTLRGTVKVTSSSYDPNAAGPNSQRAGYYFEAADSLGRRFTLGIAGGGVILNTDAALSPTNGITFTPFDATDAFHEYRLIVAGEIGSLFIDNVLIGSTPAGPAVAPGFENRVYFGDGTDFGNSQTQLSYFSYNTAAVPEPSALLLAGIASVVLAAARWFAGKSKTSRRTAS